MAGKPGSGRKPVPIELRFWKHVQKTDECWLWMGGRLDGGYGIASVQRRSVGAHRVSWMLANGPIPPGLYVCHRCDNPPCVRPDHLFLGTPSDNMRDRSRKGRNITPRGTEHYLTTLSEDDVRAIRMRHAAGEAGYKRLAKEYKVSPMTISNIIYSRTWRHVA